MKLAKAIDFLLENNYYFAVFSYPNSDSYSLIVETEKKSTDHFAIETFEGDKYNIQADLTCNHNSLDLVFDLAPQAPKESAKEADMRFFSKETYIDYVQHIVKECTQGTIKKSVAARKLKVDLPDHFSVGSFYCKLLSRYQNAFVHISFSTFGIWTGASPELLLEKTNNQYKTTSLAGTKRVEANRNWTNKEKEEQQIVTDYIVNTLVDLKVNDLEISETYTQNAGSIEHLKTDILFKSDSKDDAILTQLNPTPAVCGLPKSKAMKLINEFEVTRGPYSGYVGFKSESKISLFVNLRCMQVKSEYAILNIGAGITSDSVAEKEWEETINKGKVLGELIG